MEEEAWEEEAFALRPLRADLFQPQWKCASQRSDWKKTISNRLRGRQSVPSGPR
jgi:hypothetical protein